MFKRLLPLLIVFLGIGFFTVNSAEAATHVSINFLNKTGHTLCTLNITPSSANYWTNDVLGNSQMKPWASRTFSIASGQYDIRALDCGGNEVATLYNASLTYNQAFDVVSDNNPAPNGGGSSGGCVIPPSGPWPACTTGGGGGGSASTPATVQFVVVNDSWTTFCGLYITPVSASTWGNNWLGNSTLNGGTSRSFNVQPGMYDLAVTNCNGDIIAERYSVSLYEPLTWTLYQ